MSGRARVTPEQLRFQREIVGRLQAAGHSIADVADAAGVDDSMPSKWTTQGEDPRGMSAYELARIGRVLGWEAVLGSELRRAGLRLVSDAEADAQSRVSLSRLAGRTSAAAAALTSATLEAEADGVISETEHAELTAQLHTLDTCRDELQARLRAARR